MRKNTVKEALAEGKIQLGTGFEQLRSPEIPKILAAAGFHWPFIEHMNANTMVVMQIETRRALDMREELLAVPGVDAVMVGPADLSISLGVPGEFQHPKMVEAMEAIRDTCIRRAIAPGTQTRSPGLAHFWKDRGMTFLGCNNDTGMLFERASELVSQISAA